MTKEQYARMTGCVRSVTNRLPGGSKILRAPTLVCAAVYCMTLIYLMFTGDMRIIRAVLVPAACFLTATALRPAIGKQRPYDRFDTPPVGSYRPGKGKRMTSRHTASAAAIACAVIYVFPTVPVILAMVLLCLVIAALRVLAGQHDVSDVLAALALSMVLSLIGYLL